MPATAFRIARCNDALASRSAEECKALAFVARRAIDKACAQRARMRRERAPKATGLDDLAHKPARAPTAASGVLSPPVNREWAHLYDQAMRAFVADVETRLTVLEEAEPLVKRVTFKLSEINDALPPLAMPPAPKRAHSKKDPAEPLIKRVTFKLGEIGDALPPPAMPSMLKRMHSEGEAGWVTELRSCLRQGSKHWACESV